MCKLPNNSAIQMYSCFIVPWSQHSYRASESTRLTGCQAALRAGPSTGTIRGRGDQCHVQWANYTQYARNDGRGHSVCPRGIMTINTYTTITPVVQAVPIISSQVHYLIITTPAFCPHSRITPLAPLLPFNHIPGIWQHLISNLCIFVSARVLRLGLTGFAL